MKSFIIWVITITSIANIYAQNSSQQTTSKPRFEATEGVEHDANKCAPEILNPSVAAKTLKNVEITKVEFTEKNTIISLCVSQEKGSFFSVSKDLSLVAGKNTYKLEKAKGIDPGEFQKIPRSGQLKLKFYFPPIDRTLKTIDLRDLCENGKLHFFEITINPNASTKDIDFDRNKTEKGFMKKDSSKWWYVKNPKYVAKSMESFKITQIDRLDTATVLYFEAYDRPDNWFYIPAHSCIQAVGGELLYVKYAEGVSIAQKVPIGSTGKKTYKLYFPKIDKDVKKINFKETNKGGNWFVFELDVSMD